MQYKDKEVCPDELGADTTTLPAESQEDMHKRFSEMKLQHTSVVEHQILVSHASPSPYALYDNST